MIKRKTLRCVVECSVGGIVEKYMGILIGMYGGKIPFGNHMPRWEGNIKVARKVVNWIHLA